MGTSQGREQDAGGKKSERELSNIKAIQIEKSYDLEMKVSWVGPLGWIKSSRSS